jgi:hypothetical protein
MIPEEEVDIRKAPYACTKGRGREYTFSGRLKSVRIFLT